MYRKNVASQFICFQMLLTATGAVATGLSPAVRRCIDGTFAAGGGTVTEDGTTGAYKYAMSQADTNGNDISFIFSAATAMPVCVNIVTTACDPTVATNFGITALPAIASGSAGAIIVSGVGTAALSVSSGLVTLAGVTHTGAVIPTVTTVTNQLTAAQIATGVWTDTVAGDFTTALSVGKSVMNGVTLGTGLTVNDITTKTGFSLSQSFPSNFSSLGITAGGHITTVDTVTTVTNQLTAAAIATGVWTDTVAGDFTTSLSVGKSVMNGVSLGTGLTVNDITTKTGYSLSSSQTFNVTGNITGNLSGTVGSVTGAVGSVTGLTASNLDATISSRMATYTQPTGFLAATFPGTVASTTNITAGTITTVTTLTGLTASDVGAIKAKTDSLTFTVPGFADVNIQYVNDTLVTGNGSVSTPWGP